MKSLILFSCRSAAVLVLSAVSLFGQSASMTAASKDPKQLVKEGRQLSSGGKQDEALALYQQALQTSPDLYDAHRATGMALDLQGKYDEARQHLAKAIEVAPTDSKVQALRTMAVSYAFEGNAPEATKFEQQAFDQQLAAKDFTAAAEIANELARIDLESGDIDQAYKWYQMGHETALRKTGMTAADKALWEFRWEHAQARIAARRGQPDEAQKHVAAARKALDQANNPEQARFYPYLTGYVA